MPVGTPPDPEGRYRFPQVHPAALKIIFLPWPSLCMSETVISLLTNVAVPKWESLGVLLEITLKFDVIKPHF